MPVIPLAVAKTHAVACAKFACCTTAEHAAVALACSLDEARAACKNLADAGYFRATLLPGFGNKICYQPTAKAAGCDQKNQPKILRPGVSASTRLRGLLRAEICFVQRSNLPFLSADDTKNICAELSIPTAGHAQALLAHGENWDIFVPVLRADKAIAAVESAAWRWLPLLESGNAKLHFAALPNVAEAVRAAINIIAPADPGDAIRAEIAELKTKIRDDQTGMTGIKFGRQLADMERELAHLPAADSSYPAMGDVITMGAK